MDALDVLPTANVEPRGFRLEADGMRVDLPAVDVVEAVKAEAGKLIVLALDARATDRFRREHDLPRRQVVHATSASVRGYTDCEVVVLPGWHDRPDAEQIWASMLPGLLCNPRRVRGAR